MTTVRALWLSVPLLVRAVLSGLAAAMAGTLPWAILILANTQHLSVVPWAVPIMAGYLWLYWRYVRGHGWPQSTAAARRTNSRANRLPADVWGPALLAGILGLVAVLLLQEVLSRLVSLPQQRDLDISRFPAATVLLWVLMSAVVAGVVEETSFRGYMQRPIEQRHGPVIAILVPGLVFGLGHFTHSEVTLVLLPYFLAVAAVYGALAHLTDSTLPSMVLHAGGNVFSAVGLFLGGRSEWQLSSAPEPLIWEAGPDASFWFSLLALLLVGATAVWAYSGLSRAAQGLAIKRRAAVLLVALAVSGVAACESSSRLLPGRNAGEGEAEADLIRATERERLRALVEANVVRARQLHADDF